MSPAPFVLLLALCAISAPAQDAPIPLESVTATGTSIPQSLILELAGLHPGALIDPPAIDAACKRLEQTGLFGSIAYRYAPGPNKGYAVTLTLTEQAPLSEAAIDVPGADEAEAWQWLAARFHRFDHQIPQADSAQQFLTRELERHLSPALRGQHLTTRLETDFATRKLVISFQPEVLPHLLSVAFTGNRAIASSALNALLNRTAINQNYTRRSFAAALELNLRPLYEERGFYRVRFAPSAPQWSEPGIAGSGIAGSGIAGSGVTVSVAISEGEAYQLGKVQLLGEDLPSDAMLAAAKFQSGRLANGSEIQKSLWAMERVVRRTGFFTATALPEPSFDDAARILTLRVRIAKGPLYHFGAVGFTGLNPAQEAIARRLWRPKPGDPYDFLYTSEFFQALAREADLHAFRKYDAVVRPAPGDHVMNLTLVFELR